MLGRGRDAGFFRFLAVMVVAMYAIYGVSMGLFRGALPAAISALKVPILYVGTLGICFPAFYVCNCVAGPRFSVTASIRLLLLAVSANAVALCSYSPLSYFFALTTSEGGYAFLIFMHVVVFGLSAFLSLAIISVIFHAAAAGKGKRIGPALAWVWGVLYAFVGTEMAWVLRPWVGWGDIEYTIFRPLQESFIESLLRVLKIVF